MTTNLTQSISAKPFSLSLKKKKNHAYMWNALWKLFAPWSDNCSSFPGWWSCGRPCMSSARLADCTWLSEYWADSLLRWPHLVMEAAGVDWKIESRFNTFPNRTSTDLSKVAVRVHDCVWSLCKIKWLCSFSHFRLVLFESLRFELFDPIMDAYKARALFDICYDEMWIVLIILSYF